MVTALRQFLFELNYIVKKYNGMYVYIYIIKEKYENIWYPNITHKSAQKINGETTINIIKRRTTHAHHSLSRVNEFGNYDRVEEMRQFQ